MNPPTVLAVLGDPLEYTRSPVLHQAGLDWLGESGTSEAVRTSPGHLARQLAELERRGLRGVNLTLPLKEVVLPLLARVSPAARAARSVNTVGFDPEGWWGDTTDGAGMLDLLHTLGRAVHGVSACLLGAGGAARSVGLALRGAGLGALTVVARRPEMARLSWSGIPDVAFADWQSADSVRALRRADLVILATPAVAASHPALGEVPVRALVVDLAYGPRIPARVSEARARGMEAYDGLGLLVFQARRSLQLWYDRPVPVDPLARAVGWPR